MVDQQEVRVEHCLEQRWKLGHIPTQQGCVHLTGGHKAVSEGEGGQSVGME